MKFMTRVVTFKRRAGEKGIVPMWNMYTAAKNRLASNQDSTSGVLFRLACKKNFSVQQRVAENSSSDSQTLDLLAQHQSANVRSAVAQNENTSELTMNSLAADLSADVRYAMAENPLTDEILLETLAGDENPYVQDRARRSQARLRAEETFLSDSGRA